VNSTRLPVILAEAQNFKLTVAVVGPRMVARPESEARLIPSLLSNPGTGPGHTSGNTTSDCGAVPVSKY
jgi:hypothetical protein